MNEDAIRNYLLNTVKYEEDKSIDQELSYMRNVFIGLIALMMGMAFIMGVLVLC